MQPVAPKHTESGVAYWTLGSGPPLVCVHGGPGMDHKFFRPALDTLTRNRSVVYLDLPGHGASGTPPAYGLHTMAMAIEDVRLHLAAETISLLGSSYGGFLSLIYALTFPDHLHAVVLVDTSASYGFRAESLDVAQKRGTPEMLSALDRLWDGSLANDDEFYKAWRTIFPLYFHRLSVSEVHNIADTARYRLQTRKMVLPTLRDYDLRDRLGYIRAPALVIAGRHDWITSVTQAEELAAGIPNSNLHIFESSGHYPFLDEPDGFRSLVDDWLRARNA